MLSVLALLCHLAITPTVIVTVAGDSVVVTIAVADNVAAQPLAVDSVEVSTYAAGMIQTVRVAKQASSTTARIAFPLTLWTPNNTAGGAITVRLGRIASACAGGVCWSAATTKGSASDWAWAYLLDARAPAPADSAAISVESIGLN